MASLSHFWVLTLFLVTVLRASHVASSDQSRDGSQVAEDLGSLPATRKLLDSTSIGKANGRSGTWCVAHDGTPDPKLKGNLDYACSHGADCKAIQPGGSCFEPNTLPSHAAYAMNGYFQSNGRNPQSCSFDGTGMITNTDPSYGNCQYPG